MSKSRFNRNISSMPLKNKLDTLRLLTATVMKRLRKGLLVKYVNEGAKT